MEHEIAHGRQPGLKGEIRNLVELGGSPAADLLARWAEDGRLEWAIRLQAAEAPAGVGDQRAEALWARLQAERRRTRRRGHKWTGTITGYRPTAEIESRFEALVVSPRPGPLQRLLRAATRRL